MTEEIKRAFNEYLGFPFEEMDDIHQSIYEPDFETFQAGFMAAVKWLKKEGK